MEKVYVCITSTVFVL